MKTARTYIEDPLKEGGWSKVMWFTNTMQRSSFLVICFSIRFPINNIKIKLRRPVKYKGDELFEPQKWLTHGPALRISNHSAAPQWSQDDGISSGNAISPRRTLLMATDWLNVWLTRTHRRLSFVFFFIVSPRGSFMSIWTDMYINLKSYQHRSIQID